MDWIVECGQLYKVCAAFPEIVSCHVSAFVAGRQAAGWVAALQCCAECPSCSSTINASVNVMKSLHFPDLAHSKSYSSRHVQVKSISPAR